MQWQVCAGEGECGARSAASAAPSGRIRSCTVGHHGCGGRRAVSFGDCGNPAPQAAIGKVLCGDPPGRCAASLCSTFALELGVGDRLPHASADMDLGLQRHRQGRDLRPGAVPHQLIHAGEAERNLARSARCDRVVREREGDKHLRAGHHPELRRLPRGGDRGTGDRSAPRRARSRRRHVRWIGAHLPRRRPRADENIDRSSCPGARHGRNRSSTNWRTVTRYYGTRSRCAEAPPIRRPFPERPIRREVRRRRVCRRSGSGRLLRRLAPVCRSDGRGERQNGPVGFGRFRIR